MTIASPFESGEAARLYDLRSLNLLDTPREELYDSIVSLAAALFETPMAFVSLLDADRQWIKAAQGIDFCSTSRAVSFCAYAIDEPTTMVVEDTMLDPRFREHPLVFGKPGLRFYAGTQLVTSRRYCVGTLCVSDVRPRTFEAEKYRMLERLARVVVAGFETRR